jgi:DNA invertase Pin-like site-specific DNA recombinase
MSPKKISAPLDIYVRVSDVRGRSGESFISPKDQEQRCRALAVARDYKVGKVFTDLDVSGGKMSRPELDKAIARIEEGVSGGIIVAKLDRFARTLVAGLQTLEQINELGGAVIVADGEFDTSTATGELVLNMMLSLAQFELRRIGEQWLSARTRAVERGVHVSRHVPPGYQKRRDDGVLVPHPRHAATVREAYAMASRGESYSRIAAYLTKRKLPIGGNGDSAWESYRIRRLLANRVYIGEARSGKGIVNEAAHAPLVDREVFLLAQREKPAPELTGDVTTVLAGICRCASCSYAMRSQHPRGGTVAAYRCRTNSVNGRCPQPSTISMLRLEDYVIGEFLARGNTTLEASDEDADDGSLFVRAAVDAEASYRQALTNTELRRRIGDADHDKLIAKLHDDWTSALALVPAPTRPQPALGSSDLAALVEDLRERGEVTDLRELLASGIQAVFVRPATSRAKNLPIADRVHIVWAGDPALELPKRGSRFAPRAFTWPPD